MSTGSAGWIDTLRQDVRYALRGIARTPAFTAAVVLTLALGIGANAAIFSVVDRLLFRPPPRLIDPGAVHAVYTARSFRGDTRAFSGMPYARYVDLARWTHGFSRVAGFTERKMVVGTGDGARELRTAAVSASFFDFFDAPPALGRYFGAREDSPAVTAPVAVLSWAYWQTRYGGRRDVLGKTVQVGPAVYTIIGVAPRGFVGLWMETPPALFVPLTTFASADARSFGLKESWATTYHWTWMQMMVRRAPGVTVAAASAELTDAFRRSYDAERATSPAAPPPEVARPRAFVASILRDRGPNESGVAHVAGWIGGVAIIVLLIACANVANLFLARALRRRREIAVRLALGVSRARLATQLLTESTLLALVGGAAGLVIAQWGGAILRDAFVPGSASAPVIADGRTVLFAGGAVLAAGLLTGLAPVLQSRRADLTLDLKGGAREGASHRSRGRVALLVLQGALSTVLLVGAGLFVQSLRHVRAMRLGYDVRPVLIAELDMRGVTLDSVHRAALRERLLGAAKSLPIVETASLQTSVPFWSTWDVELHVPGIDSVSRIGEFDLNAVGPEYFATMGTRILRGRALSRTDVQGAPLAMVVSQSMARALWPGRDPIGECVKVGADTVPCTYVVGVAEDIKANQLSGDPGYYYYLSAAQFEPQQGGLFIRVRGDAARSAEAVRRALQREMPGAAYVTVTPFGDIVGQEMRSWRVGATMFLAFGALALLLAALGLYSVIAYAVAQRTHELGVRVALGAQARDVVRLVLGEGLRLGVLGIAAGAVVALIAGRWVAPLLFRESPRDPLVFAVSALVLLAAALAASAAPAARAARVDPNRALRSE